MMKKYKYIILGAGPSGLTFAHSLLYGGISPENILILEQEKEPGGLCRSCWIDGAPLDIGGGHFLDTRNQKALDFLFQFMPLEEWNTFTRISKIHLHNYEIDYPLEANLWQLSLEQQINYLESIAQAGCVQGKPMPDTFDEWIIWKLGLNIAQNYMIPYNTKIFSLPLNLLGTYWLYKLPDVSFRETLLSCITKKRYNKYPAHGTFYYPKSYGYGEVWKRMGKKLGDSLHCGIKIYSIDFNKKIINEQYKYSYLINSIPWRAWVDISPLPDMVRASMCALRYASIDIDYFGTNLSSSAHWIYEPNLIYSYHRQLLRSNFIPKAKGYWTETNSLRSEAPRGWRHRNNFAYPINTKDKPAHIKIITEWAKEYKILPLGRWGHWEHMNSDIAVSNACECARNHLKNISIQ